MSITRMEAQLERLNSKIKGCEEQLAEVKEQRKQLKARIATAKKAAKEGQPLPPEAATEGLTERIGAALTEKVLNPLGELLSPKPEKIIADQPDAAPGTVPIRRK